MRSVSLPPMKPLRISRNVAMSLPSANETSRSIASPAVSAFTFFAIRCVSITIWLA